MVIHIQVIQFLLIFLTYRIVDGEELHEVVGRICKLWHRPLDLLEVSDGLLGVTLVDDVTVGHENKLIEVVEGL